MFVQEKSLTGAPSSATVPDRFGRRLRASVEDQGPQRSGCFWIDSLSDVNPKRLSGRRVWRLRFFRAHERLPLVG